MSAFTLQDAVSALIRLGCKPTKSGDQFVAFCPIHEADGQGHNPSLTLKAGDKQPVIVNCHAGCDRREILKALGLNGTTHPAASIVAVYRYTDESGALVSEKIRHEPKRFSQRYPDGDGGFVYQRPKHAPPVLYRLPEVKAAIADGRTVFVCEGEKDADRLAKLGLVATTNVEGAAQPDQVAKWRTEYTAQLSGAARVILLPDNDPPGRAHMTHVAQQLRGNVADLRVLELPELPAKGDVSDWLNAGHTVDELQALVAKAPPPEQEPPETSFVWIDEFCSQPTESSWLVRGYFERDSLAAIFGDSEAGKSFIAIDISCHVAHGLKWRNRKVTQGIVLYIAGEGQNGLKRRFKAWHERHGIPPKNIAVRTIPTALCEPTSVDALIEHINRLLAGMDQRPVLIVIDTLNRNFGGGDENSTKDMTAFVAGITRLRIATGACVLVIHHCGHADKTRMRSAISLHNAVDSEYLIARTGERDDLKTLVTTMTTVRGKDNGDGAPLAWAWSLQSLPWTEVDDEGNEVGLASVVLEPTEVTAAAVACGLNRPQRIALQALHDEVKKSVDGWAFIADWRRESLHLGVSLSEGKAARYNAFNRAVESLHKARAVENQGEKWRPIKAVQLNSTKSTKSTNSLHVDNVDCGQSGGEEVYKVYTPLKGCRHVDSPQAPDRNEQTPSPNATDSPLARHCVTCRHLTADRCQLRGEIIEQPEVGTCLKWEVRPQPAGDNKERF